MSLLAKKSPQTPQGHFYFFLRWSFGCFSWKSKPPVKTAHYSFALSVVCQKYCDCCLKFLLLFSWCCRVREWRYFWDRKSRNLRRCLSQNLIDAFLKETGKKLEMIEFVMNFFLLYKSNIPGLTWYVAIDLMFGQVEIQVKPAGPEVSALKVLWKFSGDACAQRAKPGFSAISSSSKFPNSSTSHLKNWHFL